MLVPPPMVNSYTEEAHRLWRKQELAANGEPLFAE